jgi:hypothetical protein
MRHTGPNLSRMLSVTFPLYPNCCQIRARLEPTRRAIRVDFRDVRDESANTPIAALMRTWQHVAFGANC